MLLRIQGDEDFAVGRTDGRGVAEGEVRCRRWQADVVEDRDEFLRRNDLADDVLDAAEDPFGLLDAGAVGRAHVEPELSGVDQREKIARRGTR